MGNNVVEPLVHALRRRIGRMFTPSDDTLPQGHEDLRVQTAPRFVFSLLRRSRCLRRPSAMKVLKHKFII